MFSDTLRSDVKELGMRLNTFCKAFDYLENLNKNFYTIVETGSVRMYPCHFHDDGDSTILWDRFVNYRDGLVITIDTNHSCSELIKQHCSSKVKAFTADSIQFLWKLEVDNIDLLYLDTIDISTEHPSDSMLHHFMEFASILPKLKNGCLVMVDDNLKYAGKGLYIDRFFKRLGIERYLDDYQLGWVLTK